MKEVNRICQFCKKPFKIDKRLVKYALKTNTNKKGKYCSNNCKIQDSKTKVKIKCTNCEKEFRKLPNQIKRSKNHFCSRSCSATYNNKHKKIGKRRSKLEKYLERQLNNDFKDVLIITYNSKNEIKYELDIYIPSLNLAFEINGIYHYQPIHGDEKLLKIQNIDRKKKIKCQKKNIRLIEINTTSQKVFTEDSSKLFLNQIKDFIHLYKALSQY